MPLEPVEKNAVVNGVRLTYFERGVAHKGQTPTFLFMHATGFHARVWDKIIDGLGDCHSIAVDQRGHGRSEKIPVGHWDDVITDCRELIEQLDLQNIIAIGHSMGGHALIGAAGDCESRFQRIIGVDPVIPEEGAFSNDQRFEGEPADHPTAKRRSEFSSPEEMAERLRSKGSYGIFDPDMFMDYCNWGLLPNENGPGYVLACPPVIEASVYMSARSNKEIYQTIRKLSLPVLILRAKLPDPNRDVMDFASSPTWPGLAGEFKNGREIHYADKTHFLPMEIPAEVIQIIREEAGLS